MLKIRKENMSIVEKSEEIEKIINSGEYKLLKYDLDNRRGTVAVVQGSKEKKKCRINIGKTTIHDGICYLLNYGQEITGVDEISDFLDQIKKETAPEILTGDKVAVFCYSRKTNEKYLRLLKVGEVNGDTAVAVTFTDI